MNCWFVVPCAPDSAPVARRLGPIAILVAASLVAGSSRESFAQASTSARAGDVFFSNRTSVPLTIQCLSYVDGDGDRGTVGGSWSVSPGGGLYLKVKGGGVESPLRARRFDYRATTAEGSSDWSCAYIDRDGDLLVSFTEADLAAHLKRAARGGLVETSAVRTIVGSGEVYIRNQTSRNATIAGLGYLDPSGTRRTIGPGRWEFAPGESAYLIQEGSRIKARRFDLSVTIDGTTSSWYIDNTEDLKDGRLVFTIDDEVLARHRAGGRPDDPGPSAAQVQNAIAKLIGALVAQSVATSGDSDEDGILAFMTRGIAVAGREALVESAVDDLFGSMTSGERASIRRVIGLVLEGRLTPEGFSQASREDAIKAALKGEAPDLAGVVDVVDFLAKLQIARDQAR